MGFYPEQTNQWRLKKYHKKYIPKEMNILIVEDGPRIAKESNG
jgi:hypothetical protein